MRRAAIASRRYLYITCTWLPARQAGGTCVLGGMIMYHTVYLFEVLQYGLYRVQYYLAREYPTGTHIRVLTQSVTVPYRLTQRAARSRELLYLGIPTCTRLVLSRMRSTNVLYSRSSLMRHCSGWSNR